MIDGKNWMAGQNWINQFQVCCLHDGHCDLIVTIGNGIDAQRVMNDRWHTFDDPIICDDVQWVDRATCAGDSELENEYKLCL